MAFLVATLSPEVSLVRCYRLSWSSYMDDEAACGSQASYAAVGAVSRA